MLELKPSSIHNALRSLRHQQPHRSTLHHSQNHSRIPLPLRPYKPQYQTRCQYSSSSSSSSSSSAHNTTQAVSKVSLVPRLFRKSTWDLVIPKFLRSRPTTGSTAKKRNPATYFIWIYLLIGSQAIRIISVQGDHAAFMRRANTRLDLLREVVRKLQAGEEVDVEKALGTGVESEEKEWEEAMREIAEEENRWVQARRKMREKEEARRREDDEREKREEEERLDASPVAKGKNESKIVSAVGFY